MLNVSTRSAGTISRVFVRDGQAVHRGDALIAISSDEDSESLGSAHVAIGRELADQRTRLNADLAALSEVTRQQASRLREKEVSLRAQLAEIDSQLILLDKQAKIAKGLYERILPLAGKGYASIFQVEQQNSAALEAQLQYAAMARQRLEVSQQLAETEKEAATLPLDAMTKQNDVQRKLADINQSIATNELRGGAVLRAQADGIVSTIVLKPGQMVTSGQPLMAVVPTESALEAELLVPSKAIGFVREGSKVVLRYEAFPFEKFGHQFELSLVFRGAR